MIGSMQLSGLARKLDGKLIGADVAFENLSTDTRSINPGDAFLALVGERFDGNEFVAAAQKQGATAAIVSAALDLDLPRIQVADTHAALGQIARENRRRSSARLIALTGSQGKTSVKEMLAQILAVNARTLATNANLNNTIGVPLTLLRINQEHQYAVIEMGANQKGEIAFSVNAAEPDIAMITNASAAHVEGFGSLQGIVEAKGEILDGLDGQGTAILNADDANVQQWITRAANNHVVLFSYDNRKGDASYYARQVAIGDQGRVSFQLETPLGSKHIELKLLGKHNVANAVAAAAAALEAGASLSDVQTGLAACMPVQGRMNPLSGILGSDLIDDTYNASPNSFFAAIDVLATFKKHRILVTGEMRELGSESAEAHFAVGNYARESGIEELWSVGSACQDSVKAFGSAGRLFNSQEELIKACEAKASSQVAFLVKGSRGARMDIVVDALREKGGE